MNIGRILANAIVRRVAYVLVAMILAWLGFGSVQAAPPANYPDQPAAYSACRAYLTQALAWTHPDWPPNSHYTNGVCRAAGQTVYVCEVEEIYAGTSFGIKGCHYRIPAAPEAFLFPAESSCSARPNVVGAGPWSSATGQARSGSVSCSGGCATAWFRNGDGTVMGTAIGDVCSVDEMKNHCGANGAGYYWNPWLQVCEPPSEDCTAQQVKDAKTGECTDACPAGMKTNPDGQCEPEGNECPAGQIKSPVGGCLPEDGQCAAGEARRKDGTCGKDSNGDGEADDDDDDPSNDSEKETFSGGDTCNAPPACSGTPVMCGQARIQWRIDCNTRKNVNVSGGACGAMPICTGEKCDALDYSQLLMQWRTACALEKQSSDGGTGEGGQPDWTKVAGDGTEGAGEEPEGPVKTVGGDPTGRLDQTGFGGGGGTCPQLGVIELPFGVSFNLDGEPWACDLFWITRKFLQLLALFLGVLVLMGKM